jgi:hypothetical protein
MHDPGAITGGESQSTIEDLFQNIDSELRGKRVYQRGQEPEGAVAERQAQIEEENRREYESQIDEALREAEVDPASLSDKQRSRVIEIMQREGITDPLEAIEREAMEWVNDASEDGKAERILDDIDGWDVPDDAGSASETGEPPAPF